MTDFERFEFGGYRGEVRSEFADRLRDWLTGKAKGKDVKSGPTRDVIHLPGLYIKRYRDPALARAIGKTRAHKEFGMMRRCREAGIPAPLPVACLVSREDALLVTQELEDVVVLKSLVAGRGLDFDERVTLMRDLGRFVAKMHDAGIDHGDLHAGNVLLQKKSKKLFLIDLHRAAARRGALSRDRRIFGLASIMFSLSTFLTLTDLARLARSYGFSRNDYPELVKELRKFNARHSASRAGRCMETSGSFVAEEQAGARVYRLREAKLPDLSGLDALPRRKTLDDRELVLLGERCFAKIFRRRLQDLAKGDPGVRTWKNTHRLMYRHVRTPKLHALVQQSGRTILVGEWLPDARPLFDYIKERFPALDFEARDAFVYKLARFVRHIHEAGVFHKDLKANNVLVRELSDGAPEFYLIDLDRVAFGEEVDLDDRILNLAQLNAAVAVPVTRTERARFYRYYAGWSRTLNTKRKQIIADVMKITKARKHLWP